MRQVNFKPLTSPAAEAPSWYRVVHANDRGNLGVLLLLTVWVLVALIAMVWNTGEYATCRRHIQGAADSAAHAANVWVSRTSNLTAASNLVMSENGSAEVILRSVLPTRTVVQGTFDAEQRRAHQLLDGSERGQPEKNIPDCEYFDELVGTGSWTGKGRGDVRMQEFSALKPDVIRGLTKVLPLLPAQDAQQLQQRTNQSLQQNELALQWLVGKYLGKRGAGPPGQGGGAAAFVGNWIGSDVRPRLQDILSSLDAEQAWLNQFAAQTDPALSGTTPDEMRQARRLIFEYQQEIRRLTPEVINEQRDALAEFYACEITSAVPGRRTAPPHPTKVEAPVKPARQVSNQTHVDSIRQRYPQAAKARFNTASPTVKVDAINVNIGRSIIWHPGSSVDAPTGVVLGGQTFSGIFHVGGGEWGRVPCAPLSGYINDRVSRDREALRKELQAIDRVRDDLRGKIYPPPTPPSLSDLPATIGGAGPGADPIPLPPARIPTLPSPKGLTAADREYINAVNERIRQFDSDTRTYVHDLRQLPQALQRMYDNLSNLSDRASARFADATWLGFVESNRDLVLREMGSDKHFMVLATYELRQIPDWALEGMRDDVHQYVYKVVYSRNIGRVTRVIRSQLQKWAMGAMNSQSPPAGGSGPGNTQAAATQFANQTAPPIASDVVRRAAEIVAQEVADEWVRRPWPFEIEPPGESVSPVQGLSDNERKRYFTSLNAAMTTGDTAPQLLLPQLFAPKHKSKPLVAFAQGETFNWMEFNEGYGADSTYDRITSYGHGDMGGSPRPWRLSTTGGWNWQPRLAFSDAVGQAIEDGRHFRDFLKKGGVSQHGQDTDDAVQTLTLH